MLFYIAGCCCSVLCLSMLAFLYFKIKARHKRVGISSSLPKLEKRVLIDILLCFLYIVSFFLLLVLFLSMPTFVISNVAPNKSLYRLSIVLLLALPMLFVQKVAAVFTYVLSEIIIGNDDIVQFIVRPYHLKEKSTTYHFSDIVSGEFITVTHSKTNRYTDKYKFLFLYNKRRHCILKVETRTLGFGNFHKELIAYGIPINKGTPRHHVKKSVIETYFE